jgi:3-oxoacyl-[acyl-carrier protein] reductase
MSDQWVLISAASKGIGYAIAQKCASAGYRCIGMARTEPSDTSPFEEFVCVDLADAVQTAHALESVVKKFKVTRLVNNMGLTHSAALEEVQLADIDRLVNLNLRTTIQVTQALLPAMHDARFGRIVNISSRAAMGKARRTVYSAVKSGVHGLTRSWALELSPYITVNCVAPGPIETEMFKSVNADASPATKKILGNMPAGRWGQPREVAHSVVHFLDDDAGFTTGQVLHVCGGLTIGQTG